MDRPNLRGISCVRLVKIRSPAFKNDIVTITLVSGNIPCRHWVGLRSTMYAFNGNIAAEMALVMYVAVVVAVLFLWQSASIQAGLMGDPYWAWSVNPGRPWQTQAGSLANDITARPAGSSLVSCCVLHQTRANNGLPLHIMAHNCSR